MLRFEGFIELRHQKLHTANIRPIGRLLIPQDEDRLNNRRGKKLRTRPKVMPDHIISPFRSENT